MQIDPKKTTIASKATERPPMRPDLRDDPREAAKRRSEEIRKHLGGIEDVIDDFYIDESVIPEGWSYEWKRHTLMGQQDPAYQIQLARMGWTPVPASRHPDMMPINTKYDTVERKGMVLMERPVEITEEVRRIENKRARDQVRVKEQQLNSAPDGQFTRDHERVKPRIKKGYEPIEIPSND